MSDLPNIAILLLTYNRTEMALRTVKSTIENLEYPQENLAFYVADDGSAVWHPESILSAVGMSGIRIIGSHSERIRKHGEHDTHFAGAGWNKGLGLCHQYSDFVLVLEDDWDLDEPLNLVPYVKLLQEREDVGAVTFRILSTGADVHTVGHNGEIFLRYDRTTQYAYSGNPHLRHARYTTKYGWFAEDRNPGLIELHQDDQYRLATEGPEIWRPVGISQWGAWKHIGNIKTWE